MDDKEAGESGAQHGSPPWSDASIRASIEQLIASGKDLAEAELAWVRLKGLTIAGIARRGVLFAIAAAACLIVGLALVLVAAVVALTPLVGLLAATLIISALAFIATWLFGRLAQRAWIEIFGEEAP